MTVSISLTDDQQEAVDRIVDFYELPRERITIAGYAGTGKTTVIGQAMNKIVEESPTRPRVAFCTYTGKASFVLESRIESSPYMMNSEDYCGTIHSLMYHPKKVKDDDGNVIDIEWEKVTSLDYDLIVIDEASMVTEQVYEDLRSYDIPIVAVGDHGQLPPVGDDFSLMSDPDFALEKIHRQAKGNPIIEVSIMAREDGHIPEKKWGDKVLKTSNSGIIKSIPDIDDWRFLCGYNKTRVSLNKMMRKNRDLKGNPQSGDDVICLMNNKEKGIFNGMTGTIESIENKGWLNKSDATIHIDGRDEPYSGTIRTDQFNRKYTIDYDDVDDDVDLFDYGYALTVHKSQGSEFPKVALFEEELGFMDDDEFRRWLYTGVTRAKEKLLIIDS